MIVCFVAQCTWVNMDAQKVQLFTVKHMEEHGRSSTAHICIFFVILSIIDMNDPTVLL